jgi:hypothetical protein
VRQLVFAHFLQTCQAIIAVKVFDEYPHDRTPLFVANSTLDPELFQECVAAWEYGFVDQVGGFGPALFQDVTELALESVIGSRVACYATRAACSVGRNGFPGRNRPCPQASVLRSKSGSGQATFPAPVRLVDYGTQGRRVRDRPDSKSNRLEMDGAP